jgi:hypothetical protein
MRGRGQGILAARNPFAPGARPTGMRVLYVIMFTLLVLALGVLEIASSREAARIANYPDEVSASPALLAR